MNGNNAPSSPMRNAEGSQIRKNGLRLAKPKAKMLGLKHRTEAQELANIRLAERGILKVQGGIYEAEELVKKAIDTHGDNTCVSWSGGRCSTAVLFMALRIDPNIKVIHNDTGVLYPETVKFVKSITRQYDINLTVAKPPCTFWEVCKKYGFPFEVRSGRGEPACCRLLKRYPTRKKLEDCGIEAEITGIRVGEAHHRMFIAAQRGQFYFAKIWGVRKYHPIALWITNELIKFIDIFNTHFSHSGSNFSHLEG